ncbi:MAG: peptidoglycan DD-metalloendopeptidase family protein [Flavobacteriales bacterium]
MKTWQWWVIGVGSASAVSTVVLTTDLAPHVEYVPEKVVVVEDTMPAAPSAYGIPLSGFVLERGTVKSGSTFGDMLAVHGIGPGKVDSLVKLADPVFDIHKMRAGHPFAFIFTDDGTHTPQWFVYEADPIEHIVFKLSPLSVDVHHRPVKVEERAVACTVTGALWNDLGSCGADPALAMKLAEVFAWTVDFYRIQKGEQFTIVYNETTVDDERYGDPEVLGVRYTSADGATEAILFGKDSTEAFFDREGNSLRKAFLKAPLKYSRMSSGFSQRRFHPVQKRFKPHLGTDYAAPYGTPILTVGDGTVEKTGYTAGNGNYVKVRHNGTYTTQYLHMRKILVRQGQHLQQGDVIGEVGSTGLANGPHVCFRFWKNGEQVDHRKEELPKAEPVAEEDRVAFNQQRDLLLAKLDAAERKPERRTPVQF